MSIFWQNSNNLAKKCSTTPAGPVHSSPATRLDASIGVNLVWSILLTYVHPVVFLFHSFTVIVNRIFHYSFVHYGTVAVP